MRRLPPFHWTELLAPGLLLVFLLLVLLVVIRGLLAQPSLTL